MLATLFGSKTAEKVLTYLFVYSEGYPSEMARVFDLPLSMVQNQLEKFENGGILTSRLRGKVRIYQWNPRYPFIREIKDLLARHVEFLPMEIKERYYQSRTRPRKKDKE